MKEQITHIELLKLLDYNPDTGLFTWTMHRGSRALKGSVAGSVSDTGYQVIRLNNKLYKSHRLAWFYCFKEWPEYDIDHINRNKLDNSLSNLRDVPRSINNTNTLARNSLDTKGVYNNGTKFMARIQRQGKDNYLGTYTSIEEASNAIDKFIEKENANTI